MELYIIIGLITILTVAGVWEQFIVINEQKTTNNMLEGEQLHLQDALLALQKEFTEYQVGLQRDLDNLTKTSTREINHLDRKINKIKSELPSKIRKIVGHIEFAKPLDKK